MSTERVIAETVIETGVDVVLAATATAGATVLLGATAPAVAVTATAAITVWALNTGVEYVTETFFGEKKDIGELVADGAIEFAKGVKKGISVVTKWGKSLFGG